MAHFKCMRCRSRVWRDAPGDELCPGCGDPLESVGALTELVGLRSLQARPGPSRRLPPDRSAQISQQIRETVVKHRAECQRRIDTDSA